MERIFIVNEPEDSFCELTQIITEMMEFEGMTQQECIDYFMTSLGGTRYKIFPDYTPIDVIMRWVIQDSVTFEIK